MPYVIAKEGDKWTVRNLVTGRLLGRHATRAKAEAQKRIVTAKERKTG